MIIATNDIDVYDDRTQALPHTQLNEQETSMAIPDVVGMAEASELLGISRTNFNQHRARYTGRDEYMFPEPAILLCGPIWNRKDIIAYKARHTKLRAAEMKAQAQATKDKTKAIEEAKAAKKTAKATAPTAAPTVAAANGKPVKKAAAKKASPKRFGLKK